MPYIRKVVAILLLVLGLSYLSTSHAHSSPGDYQACFQGETCVVGEYFFDDNSLPITTGAACTLDSYTPAGAAHFSGVSLTPTSDGWYAHSFDTTGYTLGVYRGNICCTYDGDQLCIDKTFQVRVNNDISTSDVENAVLDADLSTHTTAGSVGERLGDPELTSQNVEDAVWNADTADHNTAGTFGNFLSGLNNLSAFDVWSYSTRTLTSFGSLITDFWAATPDEIATETDIANQTTTLQGDINSQTTTIQGDIDSQTTTIQTSIDDQTTLLQAGGTPAPTTTTTTTVDNSEELEALTDAINSQTSDISSLSNQINNLASSDSEELQNISNQISANRSYLESLTNSPVISYQSESFDSSQLETQITQAQDYLNQLYANSQQIISRLGLLALNWDSLSDTQINQELATILINMGSDASHPEYNSSIIKHLAWFSSVWPNTTTYNSFTNASSSLTNLEKVFNQVDVSGKTTDSKTLLDTALVELGTVESLIGNISSPTNTLTLNGLVKLIEGYLNSLSDSQNQLDNLLSNWTSYSLEDLQSQLVDIETEVMTVNQIPKASTMLETGGDDAQEKLYNRALALNALIDLNQKIWSNLDNSPIQTVWLETQGDNVAFRSAVYNPSPDASQPTSLQYYLPREISGDDVLSMAGDISHEYDTTQELVSVSGNFNLKPQDLKLQQLVTQDFWLYSQSELDLLKNQAQDLVNSLENTSYYSQATAIQNDINASLTSISSSQASAATPLDRIMTYRKNGLELETVFTKMLELKDLANQAQSTNSLSGFIGGIQAVSVWGIILIVIAGFVFLTIYMKKLHGQTAMPISSGVGTDLAQQTTTVNRPLASIAPAIPFLQHHNSPKATTTKRSHPRVKDKHSRMFHVLFMILTATALSGIVFGSINSTLNSSNQNSNVAAVNPQPNASAISVTDPEPSFNPVVLGATQATPSADAISKTDKESDAKPTAWIDSPSNNHGVAVYEHPSLQSKLVTNLINPTPITINESVGSWVNISFAKNGTDLTGWVLDEFITFTEPN